MTTKSISTQQTEANINRILEILADTPVRLARLSSGFSEEKIGAPLAEGERSITQELAHLINSEARASEAIYLALLVEMPLLANVHSERQWGRLLRFDLLPFAGLLAYFNLRRAVLLRVLSELDDAQWSRAVREAAKKRHESVFQKTRALALHELEHLEDLERKLR